MLKVVKSSIAAASWVILQFSLLRRNPCDKIGGFFSVSAFSDSCGEDRRLALASHKPVRRNTSSDSNSPFL